MRIHEVERAAEAEITEMLAEVRENTVRMGREDAMDSLNEINEFAAMASPRTTAAMLTILTFRLAEKG